jgi:nucleolar protein 4
MDQKQLKRVFHDAVRRRATLANPRVLRAKLLFDPGRPDENGKPRSRGIGFVEFEEHEHALAALRALNNNPTTFTSQRRPIVEFAVEDARAVRKLERRREGLDKAQRERGILAGGGAEALGADAALDSGSMKKTRGQKRREREREGGVGTQKKPWGNKKRQKTEGEDADAVGGGDGGNGEAAKKTAKPAKKSTRKPEREKKTSFSKPPAKPEKSSEAKPPEKRERVESARDLHDLVGEKSRRGLDRPVGRRAERRDKTDDLVDRYVKSSSESRKDSEHRGNAAKQSASGKRWFD